jgi:hypothetical protein
MRRGLLGWAEPILTHGGRAKGEYSEAFVAFDVAKKKHAVAIAEGGRTGEVRFVGEVENSPAAIERTIGLGDIMSGSTQRCLEWRLLPNLRSLGQKI